MKSRTTYTIVIVLLIVMGTGYLLLKEPEGPSLFSSEETLSPPSPSAPPPPSAPK